MSGMTEIQEAIQALPPTEKKALSAWLSSQATPEIPEADEAALLLSLEKAAEALDAGRGVPIREARQRVRRWASR